MEADWRTIALGELVEVFDGPHATPKKTSEGPIFLGISNLVEGRIDLTRSEHLSEQNFATWTRRVTPKAGDLVFSYETRLGQAALIPEGLRCCLGRRMGLLRVRDRSKTDPQFLLYAYLAPLFQETIRQKTIHGSTVDRIALIELPSFPVRVPNFTTQRDIAHILSTLDDKINLNRRMNQTLEAMVQTLFRSWFVNFEPVRAKAEGRQPEGLDAETTALFPSEFEQMGLPRGWSLRPLLEVAELLSGGTPKTSVPAYWDGPIKWASAKDVSQCGSFFLLKTERTVTERGVEESSTKIIPRDCLVVVARGATCGRFTVLSEPMAMNQTCYALRPRALEARWYLRFAAERQLAMLVQQAHGSVFDTITTSTFSTARVTWPSPKVLRVFEASVSPFVERIRLNQQQIESLSLLRDLLLPKLLSGEIRVRDAEAQLAASA